MDRRLELGVVKTLAKIDSGIDFVLYRPAVVKALSWSPVFWSCSVAKTSVALDERWGTGYWNGGPIPEGLCEACGRRAAWLTLGGRDSDEEAQAFEPSDDGYYLANRSVALCGWCKVPEDFVIHDEQELSTALSSAAARSVSWSWR